MAVPVAPESQASALLGGRYDLQERLGRGSSATVFAAVDRRFARPVIVKVFDPAVASEPALRARFQQQTAKAARLKHPNVAAVLDAGFAEEPGGEARPYVVTEPAGDLSLRDLLDGRVRLSPRRAVRLVRQVAAALGHAHRQGVIHADVKPENVIVDAAGQTAKLVDFSLSFVLARTGTVTRQTIARRAAYLAPEQVRGHEISEATDVYGLGVMLYEMIVGRPPFVGGTPQATAERHVLEHARPAGLYEPSIPSALEAVVGRALERDPARRWASMEAFDTALADLEAAEPRPRIEPESKAATAPQRVRTARVRVPLGSLALTVPLVAVCLAVALVLALLVPLLRGAFSLPGLGPKAEVPRMTGLTVQDARALALSRNLELIVIGDRLTDRVPKGLIIQQAPIAGWDADSKEPVRVTVSAGVSVPDVRGKSLQNATSQLSELGWRIGKAERNAFPGNPADTVVLQYPPPGEAADAPGELLLAIAQ